MFFVEFIFVSSKVIARVAASVIIIIILRDFIVDGLLYIFYEFSAVHERAGIYFDIILLVMAATVF